jgi:chromosome segregation ATPase
VDSSAVSARLIGAIFVEKGLITGEQLETALERQRATGDRLGEILIEQFGVERLDLASALAEQWAEYERQGSAEEREAQTDKRDLVAVSDEWRGPGSPDQTMTPTSVSKRPIGEIFIERGLVTDEQLADALDQQKKTGTRLGEILVASGKLSRLELASALADQWASFQKLRPPDESSAPPANGGVSPTPEVVAQPVTHVVSSELGNQVDALAARVDELAAGQVDWKPQIEQTEELLRARLEQLEELVGRQTEAGADHLRDELAALAERIEAIPAPTDEWRLELGQVAENLRTRIERVEQVSAAEQLAALRTAFDGLVERVDSLPAPSEEWRDATVELAGRIDSLAASSEGWRDAIAEVSNRIDSLPAPSEDWRDAIAELSSRIESLPAPSDEWRDAIGSIEARIAELGPASGGAGEDVRVGLDALAARVDALPVDAWRAELAEVAENLRTRLERVEQRPSGSEELGGLRAELKDLEARLDTLPQPSEEWRELIAGLATRVDALTTDEWHAESAEAADNLHKRIERVEQGMNGQARATAVTEIAERVEELARKVAETDSDGVEQKLNALTARLEALPASGEWREPLTQLAARIDGMPTPSEEWREQIASLAARVDTLRTDEWRSELAEVAENLRTRLERVEHEFGSAQAEQLDRLRSGLDGLVARVDAMPVLPLGDIRAELAELAQTLHGRMEQVDTRIAHDVDTDTLDGLLARVDELNSKVGDASALESRLAESLSALVHERAEHFEAGGAEVRRRLDDALREITAVAGVAGRVVEVEEALGARLVVTENALDEVRAANDGLSASVEERITAAEAHAADASRQASTDVASLRRELDDLRAVVSAASEATAGHIDGVSGTLQGELAALTEKFVGTGGWKDAVDTTQALVESLEMRLIESSSSEAVERNAEIESLRSELSTRVDAIESVQAKRKDVRELRDALNRVEQRVDDRGAKDDASARVVEEAVRDGLAGLGERLAATEETYLEAGRALRRSIEGLGRAISGADAHLAGVSSEPAAAAAHATSYVAFAPTPDGYRLVTCDGSPPVLGSHVEIPEYEGVLVVTRTAASPLPFDERPCVYLEPAQSSLLIARD